VVVGVLFLSSTATFFIGIWLTVKGFRPSPVTAAVTRPDGHSVAAGPTAA
jgi:hypothetical protein